MNVIYKAAAKSNIKLDITPVEIDMIEKATTPRHECYIERLDGVNCRLRFEAPGSRLGDYVWHTTYSNMGNRSTIKDCLIITLVYAASFYIVWQLTR